MQQSIDISCLPAHSSKPAAAVCGGRMMGQTDVRTPGSFIDPAAHTTPALPNAMCRSVKGRIAGAVKLIFQRRNIAEIVKIVYLRCWRWHKAHYKVISGQRTLGKFYRPASITRGPHSSGPRSACPQKRLSQERSLGKLPRCYCDSSFPISVARRTPTDAQPIASVDSPPAAAAAASLDTQSK